MINTCAAMAVGNFALLSSQGPILRLTGMLQVVVY